MNFFAQPLVFSFNPLSFSFNPLVFNFNPLDFSLKSLSFSVSGGLCEWINDQVETHGAASRGTTHLQLIYLLQLLLILQPQNICILATRSLILHTS